MEPSTDSPAGSPPQSPTDSPFDSPIGSPIHSPSPADSPVGSPVESLLDYSLISYPESFTPKTQTYLSDQEKAYNACCIDDSAALSKLLDGGWVSKRPSRYSVAPEMLLTHAAAANGSVKCLKMLLKHGWQAEDLVEVEYGDSRSPLLEAVCSMALSAVEVLLEAGAEVTHIVAREMLLATKHFRNERWKMVKILLKAAMAAPDHDHCGICNFFWIEAISDDQVEVVELCLPHMMNMGSISGSLELCADSKRCSSDTIFDLLLYSGAVGTSGCGLALGRCLTLSQASRALKIIRYETERNFGSPDASLAPLKERPIDELTYYMVLALIESLEIDNLPLVNELISKQVSPNWHSFMYLTPMHNAAAQGPPRMLQRVLQSDAGGDVHLKARGPARRGDYFFSESWQDSKGCYFHPSITTYAMAAGNTPLHTLTATARLGFKDEYRLERAEILLSAGADVNVKNGDGETPLAILERQNFDDFGDETMSDETVVKGIQALAKLIRDAGGIKQERTGMDSHITEPPVVETETCTTELDW